MPDHSFRVKNLRLSQKLLILVLTVLVLGMGQSTGTVWCLGDDGHVSFELSDDGRCLEESSSDEHGHAEDAYVCSSQDALDCCGPCFDISFSFDASVDRLRDQRIECDSLERSVGTWVSTQTSCLAPVSRPDRLTATRLSPQLAAIRVTILRV